MNPAVRCYRQFWYHEIVMHVSSQDMLGLVDNYRGSWWHCHSECRCSWALPLIVYMHPFVSVVLLSGKKTVRLDHVKHALPHHSDIAIARCFSLASSSSMHVCHQHGLCLRVGGCKQVFEKNVALFQPTTLNNHPLPFMPDPLVPPKLAYLNYSVSERAMKYQPRLIAIYRCYYVGQP